MSKKVFFIALMIAVFAFSGTLWADDIVSGYVMLRQISNAKSVTEARSVVSQVESHGKSIKFISLLRSGQNNTRFDVFLFFQGNKEEMESVKSPKMKLVNYLALTVDTYWHKGALDSTVMICSKNLGFKTAKALFAFNDKFKVFSPRFEYYSFFRTHMKNNAYTFYENRHKAIISDYFEGLKSPIIELYYDSRTQK